MTDRTTPKGMRKGLTRYGDEDFSLFLRKAFIKAMGFRARRPRAPSESRRRACPK